jgi:hypothetical protein
VVARGAAALAGLELVEDCAEAGVIAFARQVEKTRTGTDAFEIDLVLDGRVDCGLGAGIDFLGIIDIEHGNPSAAAADAAADVEDAGA